jgi:hypothetical protein
MTTRGVVLVAAFLGLSLAAPAHAVTVTTQNVYVGLARPGARHDVRQAAEHSSVVFTQEMGHRRAARFAPAHWGVVHFRGTWRGDCATYYDRRVWRVVRAWPFRIAAEGFRAGNRFAVVAVLRRVGHPGARLATVNVHSFTHTLARPVAWRREMARVRGVAGTLADRWGRVVMGGDWNRVYGRRATFPGYVSHDPPRPTGRNGGRVDYLYWHGERFRAIRVIDGTRSDHNGTRVRVTP